MKKLAISTDMEHWYLDQIADLIAYARNPQVDDDPEDISYALNLITANEEVNKAATAGLLRLRHPGTHGPFPMELGIERAVVLTPDVVAYLAGYGITAVLQTPEQMAQPAPEQEAATPAPVVQGNETKEQRQDRRLKACIDAGLPMNDRAALLRLPYGVADVAECEGVTRQAFSTDVKAALTRRASAQREGTTVHRA